MSPLKPMMSASVVERRLQDPIAGHHHAEVHDLVVVAAEHDGHDVLPDVVATSPFTVAMHDLSLAPSRTLPFRVPASAFRPP